MPAGDHQRQGAALSVGILAAKPESKDLRFPLVQQHRVNVPFEMIDGDQRQPLRKGQSLGVGDAHQQRSGQSRAAGHGDGVQIVKRDIGLGQRRAHHRDNGAQMLAAGQLRHHAAIARVGRNLRGDDRGERARAALDHGRGGLVAGGFNAEDQAADGHLFSLPASNAWTLRRITLKQSHVARHRANSMRLLQIIAEPARDAGYEAYLAGGCVRDLLLGREPNDYDVATSATPDVVLNLFPRTFAVGAHFGVVLVAARR